MTQPHVLARLRPDRSEVATARRVAAEALRSYGTANAADVELLVSELVGDALRRAAGEVELRLDIGADRILIEVRAATTDGAAEPPTLWFASALATEWGSSASDGAHRTWASLPRTPAPAVD